MTDGGLCPIVVKMSDATAEDLLAFGIRTKRHDDGGPYFKSEHGLLWKGAVSVCVYDNGLVGLWVGHHVNAREWRMVAGIAERSFNGGAAMCRREKWERLRKSSKRKVGYYRTYYWIRVDKGAEYREIWEAASGVDAMDIEGAQLLGIEREASANAA